MEESLCLDDLSVPHYEDEEFSNKMIDDLCVAKMIRVHKEDHLLYEN